MAQTAMKQMIDYLEGMKSQTTDQSEIYMLTGAWVKAIHLMQVEKEQIEDAFNNGDFMLTGCEDDAIKYYNEKFKK